VTWRLATRRPPNLFAALAIVAMLLGAGCPRGKMPEPTAEPTEVEIDWPDAGVVEPGTGTGSEGPQRYLLPGAGRQTWPGPSAMVVQLCPSGQGPAASPHWISQE